MIVRVIRDRIHAAHGPSVKTSRASSDHLVRRHAGRSREATRARRSRGAAKAARTVVPSRSGETGSKVIAREGRSPSGETNPATTVRVILDRTRAAHGPSGKTSRASIGRLAIVPEVPSPRGRTATSRVTTVRVNSDRSHAPRGPSGKTNRASIVRLDQSPPGEIDRRGIGQKEIVPEGRSLNGRTAVSPHGLARRSRAAAKAAETSRRAIDPWVLNLRGGIGNKEIVPGDRSLNGTAVPNLSGGTSRARLDRIARSRMAHRRVTHRRATIAGVVTGGRAVSTRIRAIDSRCRVT